VVAYQLISGRLPYEAGSLTELALKQQQEEPAMLDSLVAAATPQLADAVAVALALDPRDRYASAREMGRAIAAGAGGVPIDERYARGRAVHPTQATSIMGAAEHVPMPASTQGAITPRRPRPGPASGRVRVVEPLATRPHAPRSRANRLFVMLLALLVIAAVVAVVIVVTAPESTRIVLRNVVLQDVHETAGALKQLVSENAK
jgi:serine/threonine-protein kinase